MGLKKKPRRGFFRVFCNGAQVEGPGGGRLGQPGASFRLLETGVGAKGGARLNLRGGVPVRFPFDNVGCRPPGPQNRCAAMGIPLPDFFSAGFKKFRQPRGGKRPGPSGPCTARTKEAKGIISKLSNIAILSAGGKYKTFSAAGKKIFILQTLGRSQDDPGGWGGGGPWHGGPTKKKNNFQRATGGLKWGVWGLGVWVCLGI